MKRILMKPYLLLACLVVFSQELFPQRKEMVLSGKEPAWNVWLDRSAEWESDTLYLPDEVNLTTLKVNAPTCGWKELGKQGKNVKFRQRLKNSSERVINGLIMVSAGFGETFICPTTGKAKRFS